MAKRPRPGRTLSWFFAAMAGLMALVALAGTWTPALGLDLQGGQRITLRASNDDVSSSSLEEARKIISSRVNGSGITEADVTTQGDRNVVVSIPGESNQKLVDVVQRQAQLRFRLIACSTQIPGPCAEAAQGTQQPGQLPAEKPGKTGDVKAALDWRDAPNQGWVKRYNEATCPPDGEIDDSNTKPLVACDESGVKYLLTVPVIEGTELESADATQDTQQSVGDWMVQLSLKERGTNQFAEVSRALVPTNEQFAIVLDGEVISAPTMDAEITNGEASISGGTMGETEAKNLATSLKFGALPVEFDKNPKNDTIGPSLAGNQLSAGIWAGVIGLLVVMLYCLLYYRGLGLVVIASLLAAGVVTYGLVVLLSAGAGFALSLPGIAGLIVAVGITADSFIVYFERIRDEMRDGKSMRVAVESGWERARNTCLAADAVSLIAAIVLYIFAIDEVRGFAFTLGLSTLVDLAVFFWFTHPMVSWLARFKFFNQGHKLSGLDAENLGVDHLPGVARRQPVAGGAR